MNQPHTEQDVFKIIESAVNIRFILSANDWKWQYVVIEYLLSSMSARKYVYYPPDGEDIVYCLKNVFELAEQMLECTYIII